jgi:hypothetical protein
MAFGFRHFERAICQLWGGFTGCLSLLEPSLYNADSEYSRHLGWLRHFQDAVRKLDKFRSKPILFLDRGLKIMTVGSRRGYRISLGRVQENRRSGRGITRYGVLSGPRHSDK